MSFIRVEKEIRTAYQKVGRDPAEVLVLGATKDRSVAQIRQAFAAGLKVIGENRVQEMMEKLPSLPSGLRVDFIGHLQRNESSPSTEARGIRLAADVIKLR